MNRKRTLDEVIIEVLEKAGESLRVEEVYQWIIEDGLYQFKAENPVHIVRTTLRRRCVNLDFKSSKKKKYYAFLEDGSYTLKKYFKTSTHSKLHKLATEENRISDLKESHKRYTENFKKMVLQQLQKLDPSDFEVFCGNLLKEFGFKNIKVTQRSKDGGIDGFGQLKIGLAWMAVAFECKRYKSSIGRPKVNQFRGDIQGKYPQGIFFATSKFTKDAQNASFQPGAAPVVLIDGKGIVELMIEKGFGVEKEILPIYTNALDLILQK